MRQFERLGKVTAEKNKVLIFCWFESYSCHSLLV
jgi:hypothetical protein